MKDEELLDRFQSAAFRYFLENVNPVNGLIADTDRAGAPCSIAVVGFALSCYPIGVERGWITRSAALEFTLTAFRFFRSTPHNHKGLYYHFLDMRTGERVWQSELSPIDSALLLAGILTAHKYFTGEPELCGIAESLYCRMDWDWARNNGSTVTQGWKPECGFLHYGWEGYSEATILYLLGLASPTFPLPAESYGAWTSTYQWENLYGYDFLYAGPLFIHQFPHAFVDFRGLRDVFMREKGSDYFENSRRATFIQREYAIRNPREWKAYGPNYWGLSAGDGPGSHTHAMQAAGRSIFGYAARGVPYGPDDGTISPAAAFGSLPFAPEIALPAIRSICGENFRVPGGVNPSLEWASETRFGLDQGLVVMMIENYRTQFLWNLMRQCTWLTTGLRRAGFSGGWLS